MKAFRWAKMWIAHPDSPLSTFDAFVLLMIADHYNEAARRAWPKIRTLSFETRMSESTVKRCLARLKERRIVEVEQWFDNATGRQMANRYCLPLYDTRSTPAAGPVFTEWDLEGNPAGWADDGTGILMDSAATTVADKWGKSVDNMDTSPGMSDVFTGIFRDLPS
jgi:hypothetical protein